MTIDLFDSATCAKVGKCLAHAETLALYQILTVSPATIPDLVSRLNVPRAVLIYRINNLIAAGLVTADRTFKPIMYEGVIK